MRIKNGIICIIFGLIFLGFSYLMQKSDENRMQNLDRTTFSIETNYRVERDSDTTMYSPLYTYMVEGKKYVCKSNFSSSIKPSKEPRKIFYNSQMPEDCFAERGKQENALLMVFTIIPIILILLGVATMFGLVPDLTQTQEIQAHKRPVKRRRKINHTNSKDGL